MRTSNESEEDDDASLIVCVAKDTGRGYLPIAYFDPLVKRIAELIAQCDALQARLDQVAQIAGVPGNNDLQNVKEPPCDKPT